MKHLFSLLLTGSISLMLAFSARAQANSGARPGYIITLRGDTVRGLVQAAAKPTENGVSFQATEAAASKLYFPSTIRGFGETAGRQYVSRSLGITRKETINTTIVKDEKDSVTVFLQPLVRGYATLYRLDYEGNFVERTALDAFERQSTYFFLQQNGTRLVALQQETYKAILKSVFSDCAAAAAAASSTKFMESKLAELVLRYNTCHPQVQSRDLRVQYRASEPMQLAFSIQAGVSHSTVFFTSFEGLGSTRLNGTTSPILDMRLRFNANKPLGAVIGLQYTTRESSGSLLHTVPSGYRNTGQQIDLVSSIKLKSIQVPLLVHYAVGQSSLKPYLTGGLLAGGHFAQTILAAVPVFTVITQPGPTSPGVYEQQPGGTVPAGYKAEGFHPTLGLCGGVGFSAKLGKLSPLVEVRYESGMEPSDGDSVGRMRYNALVGSVGVAF
ncbi:hypothetical protein LJY25_13750 [Hymenobacter sp. BT175]|uniref:hypothetical protein n=1 Tax=Hymenobacter translucens TaxID=2886507 RepID=UPI001D0E9ABD|nr:hypothetical protein [Hymenobacter translucens]MCC2547515.1 hypothetical protein [Hymenobacter translucens]